MDNQCTVNFNFNIKGLLDNIVEYKVDTVKEVIDDSSISKARIKELTVSLLDIAKPVVAEKTSNLLDIAKYISVWEDNRELTNLKESILACYSEKEDVCCLYLSKNNNVISFIVVMDDSTADTIFDYNELGFKLTEKYKEIEDFMIMDAEEEQGCMGLLSNYNIIYKRG